MWMAIYKYKSARMLLESDLKESDFMCSIQIYDTYNVVQDLHLRVCDITILGARGVSETNLKGRTQIDR
jgi:hypothetical protein